MCLDKCPVGFGFEAVVRREGRDGDIDYSLPVIQRLSSLTWLPTRQTPPGDVNLHSAPIFHEGGTEEARTVPGNAAASV